MTGRVYKVDFDRRRAYPESMNAMLFLVSVDIATVVLPDDTLVFRAHIHSYFYFISKNSNRWISATEDRLGEYFSPKDVFTLKLMRN